MKRPALSAPIEVVWRALPRDRGTARWLEQRVPWVLAMLGASCDRLAVAVVHDREMAGLHRRHKGIGGTTDVLTFDLRDRPGQPIDADAVVCLDEARRQAMRRGHPVRHELLLYVVHALLHLLGRDDDTAAAAAAMHAEEDRLLSELGVGGVYAGKAAKQESSKAGYADPRRGRGGDRPKLASSTGTIHSLSSGKPRPPTKAKGS